MKKLLAGLALVPVVSALSLAVGVRAANASTTISSFYVTGVTSTVVKTQANGSSDKLVSVTVSLAEAVYNYNLHRYVPGTVLEQTTGFDTDGKPGDWDNESTFDLSPLPSERYMVRACVADTTTCSAWVQAKTVRGDQIVDTKAATVDGNHVTFNPTVTGLQDTCDASSAQPGHACNPRSRGILIVKYGTGTSYGKNVYSDQVEAARTGSATRAMSTWLDPHTTYHYQACYIPVARNDIGVYVPSQDPTRCGRDLTFTTGAAVTTG